MPGEHKIRTCDDCGVLIPDEDFRQQRAARYKGKVLCAECTDKLKARILAAKKATTEAKPAGDPAAPAGSPPAQQPPKDIADIPISLDDDDIIVLDEEADEAPSTQVRAFGAAAMQAQEPEYQRPLLKDTARATRCRTFHCKMSDASFRHLNLQINEWVDAHPEVEIKFALSNVGVVEGKHADPHLIVTIFY